MNSHPQLDLTGKTALVTGAGRGIGRAIALAYGALGATVICNYSKSKESAEAVASEIPDGRGLTLGFDVSDFDATQQAIEEIQKKTTPITILVNNAGISKDALLMRAKESDFDEVMGINLKGTFNVTRACVKGMVKAREGSILNISSVIGEMGNAGQSIYAASKSGLIGFTKSVAKELASRGIRANCITPGFIQSDMTDALTDSQKEQIASQIPLARLGTGEDIASLCAFLASPLSSYITGQVIGINGGLYM